MTIIVQNRAFDALAGPPSSVGASGLVSIESSSLPNFYLRHCDYLACIFL